MDELARWLRDQLDEDERIVREANTSPEMVTGIPRSYAQAPVALHIARFADPARVLREIDAKRRIVNLHARTHHQCVAEDGPTQWHAKDPCATLRLLALPYVDRPGYREEWRP
jgi:hypothetical protein